MSFQCTNRLGKTRKLLFNDLGPVVRSLVSANRWLRGIKTYRFPWYLTLVSANHASSNPGLAVCNVQANSMIFEHSLATFHVNGISKFGGICRACQFNGKPKFGHLIYKFFIQLGDRA